MEETNVLHESTTDSPEGPVLRSLFEALNASGIRYCVLRNYESLPDSLGGSDVDLCVSSEDMQNVVEIATNVAENHDGKKISDYAASGRITRFIGANDVSWGLPLDLFSGFSYRGIEYITSKDILDNSSAVGDVCVSEKNVAALCTLTKELIANSRGRKNYFSEASIACGRNARKFEDILLKGFGSKATQIMISMLERDDSSLEKEAAKILRKSLFTRLFVSPKTLLHCACDYAKRFTRIAFAPGFAVAYLGTDGSGKSTIVSETCPSLKQALHSTPHYEHLRPNWLPALGKLKDGKGHEGPVTEPHRSKSAGVLGSLARLAYYAADYTFGYWIKIYPKMVKRPQICIFDRYYYDYIIDPRRMRIGLPKWLIRLFFVFARQPNLILCLGADPEVIHARKPELPLEEVRRQVEVLKNLCKNNRRAVWIDTGQSIEQSTRDALIAIRDRMAARYEKG